MGSGESERGSASVEQAGLAALIALLLVAAIAAVAADGEIDGGQDSPACSAGGSPAPPAFPTPAITTRWSPPTAGPSPASPAPLRPRPQAASAPPACRSSRSTSAAAAAKAARSPAGPRPGRPTAFTSIRDERRALGWVELTYWMYRPSIGWERVVRRATAADIEAAAGISVLLKDDPMLVPLETLPGRDQYEFPAGERPPWQWKIESRYPGWSS